jgi:Mycothiol maleylpyruvate isomerase N-terminal domain
MTGAALVRTTYDGLRNVLSRVDDETSWTATGCLGWSVRDLTHHLVLDAQRALVALHTPAGRAADTDAVGYWSGWGADPVADANGRRFVRVTASMFREWEQLRALHEETAQAVVHAASLSDPDHVVATQGHALRTDDLLQTLAVEAAVHHVDLVTQLSDERGPAEGAVAEVRRVLEGLAGEPFPAEWPDEKVLLVGTGRAPLTREETLRLGPLAHRLPLFS